MTAPYRETPVILVVEDDRDAREMFRATLRNGGFAVYAVGDGVEALHYLAVDIPAAVVLDLGLTRLDGRDVHKEMKAQGLTEYVPVIVVTGTSETLNESDFSAVLRKPVLGDELLAAVRK